MSDFQLPPEAERQLQELERSIGRAGGIKKEIATYSDEARREFARQRGELEREREVVEALRDNHVKGSELIAKAWADYELARAKTTSQYLRSKSRPARKAAEEVKAKGKELAEARRRLKVAEYIVELYEWHFPWLVEFRDVSEGEAYLEDAAEKEESEGQDPARGWLSKQEWESLPEVERHQRALDRYLKSRKTNWQLGRDYERYIGYLREQDGCQVTYHGIFQGLEDLGRDVLAEKDGTIEVIQCKRWAQRKTIHEKHVFQLYGTMVLARLEHPKKGVTGTFTTTTTLSEKAREVADYLEIKLEEKVSLDDYPRIKCNIARRGKGEKIYHLPFDQQYDTTVVEPDRGECYVSTTLEAENRGFRRAWRWRGDAANSA